MTTVWSSAPVPLTLEPGIAHVWRVRVDEASVDLEAFRAILNEDERARASRFKFDADHDRFVIARGALRRLIAGYTGTAAAEAAFVYSKQGKPALDPDVHSRRIEFNVAHSGAIILIGVCGEHAIGVDVEKVEHRVEEDRIAERFFSPDEVDRLNALPEPDRRAAFFECWTRKEAFIKAHGHGLSLPLDSFSVAFGPGQTARLLRFEDPIGAQPWSLAAPDVAEGYKSAACVAAPGASFRWFDFEP